MMDQQALKHMINHFMPHKTPGQIAYERDCLDKPRYHTRELRKRWDELSELARWSWEKSEANR